MPDVLVVHCVPRAALLALASNPAAADAETLLARVPVVPPAAGWTGAEVLDVFGALLAFVLPHAPGPPYQLAVRLDDDGPGAYRLAAGSLDEDPQRGHVRALVQGLRLPAAAVADARAQLAAGALGPHVAYQADPPGELEPGEYVVLPLPTGRPRRLQ